MRNGDERGGEFGEYAHEDEEEARGVAGFAVGTAGEGDYAVVLREDGHGCLRRGAELEVDDGEGGRGGGGGDVRL